MADSVPDTGNIEVHFNDDDLTPALAENPAFYQLIFTRDTVDNTDDVIVTPVTVNYNNITNIATLDFPAPLSRIPDPARIRVNSCQARPGLRVGANEGPARATDRSFVAAGSQQPDRTGRHLRRTHLI